MHFGFVDLVQCADQIQPNLKNLKVTEAVLDLPPEILLKPMEEQNSCR